MQVESALATADPAVMRYHELARYAAEQRVSWYGFWTIAPCRTPQRRIWRDMYPGERDFVRRYFPLWFAEQKFSIRNATFSRRSRNLYGNNIAMAPDKYMNHGFHGGLSPIADTATLGHELLHAMDRQLGGRVRIWYSYLDRQTLSPWAESRDEADYYEFNEHVRDPARMLAQFRALNPEAQGELFEEAIRRSEAWREAIASGDQWAIALAERRARPYAQVLAFVRSLPPDGDLRSAAR